MRLLGGRSTPQYVPLVTLSLFVLRVHANDTDDALAMNDLALVKIFGPML